MTDPTDVPDVPDAPATQVDAVVPDTKDWTWVLSETCPECGFSAAELALPDVGPAVRDSVPRWRAVLARPDVRERPARGVWSPLEYAAHVRDVFRIFDERLVQILTSRDPLFENWDQDAAAVEGDYAGQDPAVLADELEQAGLVVADRFDAVAPADEERGGRRSDGSEFTARTLGQYFVHDFVHHLHDVRA